VETALVHRSDFDDRAAAEWSSRPHPSLREGWGTRPYNKPARLDFLVPATLVPGTYHLEVRARMGVPPAGPDTRELRIGRLDATLTV